MEAHETPLTTDGPVQPAVPTRRLTNALPLSLVALLISAVVLFGVLLLLRGHNGGNTTLPPVGAPAAVSETQLKALAAQTNHAIYWAGPQRGTYELTRTTDGRIYIRYVPSADKVGDHAPSYLTVGTYPTKKAFQEIQLAAARQGGVSAKIDRGGLLVFNNSNPKSVYFSYPKSSSQVEVYDPSPLQARALVLGGSIKPIR